jgi:Ricin-type beta-trefoil lectin domain-like
MANYMIVSQLNGMALDVAGASREPSALVVTFPKHGRENQQWYDDPVSGTIRSCLNGFCLDIEGNEQARND